MIRAVLLLSFILASFQTAEAQIVCSEKAIGRLVRNLTRAYDRLESAQNVLGRYQEQRVRSEINYDNRETSIENDRFEYVSDITRVANVTMCVGSINPGLCFSVGTIASCLGLGLDPQCVAYLNEIRETLLNFDSRLGKLHMQQAQKLARYDTKISRQQLKVSTAQANVTAAEAALAQCQ